MATQTAQVRHPAYTGCILSKFNHVCAYVVHIHLGLQPSLSTIHPIVVCGKPQCYGDHMIDVKYNTLGDVQYKMCTCLNSKEHWRIDT